jgi:extradiol dioxygenase
MIEALNYIGFRSPNAAEWNSFGPEILGVELAAPGPDGAVRMRVDDAAWRLSIHPGERDEVAYLGWGVAGPTALAEAVRHLADQGVAVEAGDDELARDRAVSELVWLNDPWGFRHELSWGQQTFPSTFRPGRALSGFRTGSQGVGHAVLIVPDLVAAQDFYAGVLGFRLSDQIDMNGTPLRFYHCNGRHHSLALVHIPGLVGYHHLMLETTALDDVGIAYDLVQQHGIPVAMTLGRHTNDLMTSFYVRTPSGFEIEYGFGGADVDSIPATPRAFSRTSIWGHKPPAEPLPPGIIKAHIGVAS